LYSCVKLEWRVRAEHVTDGSHVPDNFGGGVRNMIADLENKLFTIADLQKLTGESESCWRKRLGRGEIAFLKLGGNVRIRRSDLEAWFNARTVRKGVNN
jgi:excisionase family DNA binding protein